MGGIIGLIIGHIATILLYSTKSNLLFWISLVNTLVIFWSCGVMHNYAYISAKQRKRTLKKNKFAEGVSDKELKKVEMMKIKNNKI